MRKVVVYLNVSVDGVAEAPEQFVASFDDEMYANLARVIDAQDAVLLGRKTYDGWSAHWPTSDHQPFSRFINGVQKYVATSTPLASSWVNTTAIDGSVQRFVHDLKQQSGADIGVHGSIQLASSLLEAGLVDELRLVIAPAAVGGGRGLFDGGKELRRLELARSVSTPSGALLVDYRTASNA